MSISEECIDMVTPVNEYLSAKYKRSFAYHTVRERMPVTVTQVIDHLSRGKEQLVKSYGEVCKEEIKDAIGYLSKLKNEMQTNKPLIPLQSNTPDSKLWNDFLTSTEKETGRPLFWFGSIWLHVECYFYRRVREAFELTQHLHNYDPFKHLKDAAFTSSLPAITIVGQNLLRLDDEPNVDVQKYMIQFLKLSLWGNRCDLSISGGKEASQKGNPLELVDQLDSLILVNDVECAWEVLSQGVGSDRIVDIIFDNAGYELFTDLCLADFLLKYKLVDKVRFHAKTMPWFVSDVMVPDFHWTLSAMAKESEESCLPSLSRRWKAHVDSGRWVISAEHFWTLPFSYDCMQVIDPELYHQLSETCFIIFKGDLNYRKLMGDINWAYTEKFSVALRGFHPAPLMSLRTIKADVVTGLKEGQAEQTAEVDADWMLTGKYAVISCTF